MSAQAITSVDSTTLEAASLELERFCAAAGLDLAEISGAELSGRRRRLRNEAVIEVRRTTPACYDTLGHLLEADPEALQRSVRGALELPHW